jgi:hypothetical protein
MDHVQDPSLVPSSPCADKAEGMSSNVEKGKSIAPQAQGINRSWPRGSYPKLALLMASCPETAIFRRFGALNTQNLLFLQAEVTHLERELEILRGNNELNNSERSFRGDRNWFELSQESEGGEPDPQWVVIQDIRDRLKEYSRPLQSDSGPVCLY